MKKFLAVLLAALMIFSITTVAFAADDEVQDPETTVVDGEETAEDSFDVTELPLWTVFAGLKMGKIVLKLAVVVLKIASALGLIDLAEIAQGIIDSINNGGDAPVDDTPVVDTVPEAA